MDQRNSARKDARWRTAAVVAASLALIALLGLVGPASPAGAEELAVDGDLRIVGWFGSPPAGCPDDAFLGLDYEGTGASDALGEITAEVAFCVVTSRVKPAAFAVVEGAFTFTTDRGTLTGDIVDGHAPRPLRLVLAVTGGTGDFVDAAGTLVYDADGGATVEGFVHEGTFTGTLTLPDRPESPDDCKDGAWRDLVDETGEPFANQGLCVAWAIHHA
jgi:hypothetical protein